MRKIWTILLIIFAIIGGIHIYINIHRYINTETFFRYKITFVFELRDYFNQKTIENEMFGYIVKNDTLYVYGLSGYTKVKLGLAIQIIPTLDGRGSFYSSINELREEYGNNLILENNFEKLNDTDISIFIELFNEAKSRELVHYTFLEDSGDLYKDGKKIGQGLRLLNDSLIKEYEKRNKK